MTDATLLANARAQEAASLAALLAQARQLQAIALARSPQPPRFLVEAGRAMAAHLRMTEGEMEARLGTMAFWQLYLGSALGGQPSGFELLRERFPATFARLRTTLREQARPQLVVAAFHMAGVALLSGLLAGAARSLDEGPLHALVATRNLAWFRLENNRWLSEAVHIFGTRPADLRELLSGLKDGSVRRLLILVDGPQSPETPGTQALTGLSPALAFRTGLLRRIHALGIPLLPVTHCWEDERLLVTPQPLLEPAAVSDADCVAAIAGHIEGLLRRHPEQWLNWNGARIRT